MFARQRTSSSWSVAERVPEQERPRVVARGSNLIELCVAPAQQGQAVGVWSNHSVAAGRKVDQGRLADLVEERTRIG